MAMLVRMGKKTADLSMSLVQRTIAISRPKLVVFWGHARKELVPPMPGEMGRAMEEAGRVYNNFVTMKFLNLTVKEGGRNALVVLEIMCWFFVGEIIGRGSIIGYKLPGEEK